MRRGAALAAVLVALAGAACGTPSPDLFVVERSGELPGAELRLVVGDGGTVRCDGTERPLTDERLLDARTLAEELQPVLDRRPVLPRRRGALLRYRVLGEAGEARFWDTSVTREPVLGRLVQFTRAVAREACGRPR